MKLLYSKITVWGIGGITWIYLTLTEGVNASLPFCGALIFPAICIFFADGLAGFVGPTSRGAITSESPSAMVEFMGYFLILLFCSLFLWVL